MGVTKDLAARTELPFGQGTDGVAYFTLSGCVTVDLGRERKIVEVCWPGDLLGTSGGRAQAVVETRVIRIPQEALLTEMSRNAALTAWVWRQQRQRLDELQHRILLACQPVERRITDTLIWLDRRARESTADGVIPLTQQELADLAGATRETTSTYLNRLRRMGVVLMHRRRIYVPTPERLFAVRSSDPARGAAA